MIVGREQIIFFEKLAKMQKQIYPDACDHGVDCSGSNFGVKIQARKALIDLMMDFKYDIVKWGDPNLSHGSTTSVFVPYEQDGPNYLGVILKISHNVDCTRRKEFLTVDMDRCCQQENPWKED